MNEEVSQELKQTRVLIWVSAMILAMGLIIYISWGLLYNSWNIFSRENLGIYALMVIFIGFGLLGLILNIRKARSIQ